MRSILQASQFQYVKAARLACSNNMGKPELCNGQNALAVCLRLPAMHGKKGGVVVLIHQAAAESAKPHEYQPDWVLAHALLGR